MKLHILAGTLEAHKLARALRDVPGVSATVSLARPDPRIGDFGWPLRTSGWQGAAGYRGWLRAEGVEAVIDATQAFASRITTRTRRTAAALGLPHLRLLRPGWTAEAGDRWTGIGREGETARVVPEGATVFIGTGRATLDDFAGLTDRKLWFRVRAKPRLPFPYPNGGFRFDEGPFTVAGETQLFRELDVDWLVVRNAGGEGGWPKLGAARNLGIEVAMVRRPEEPDGPRAETVAEALDWVGGLQ